MVNNATMQGQLTEMVNRVEEHGRAIVTFGLRGSFEYAGVTGWQNEPVWLLCEARGHAANSTWKYWSQGCRVMVTGRLRSRAAGDGSERTQLYLEVESIGFISPRQTMEAIS
jgi:single-stranded DNA-binding protein